ncbi:glycoside hydrolase family 76 protein [Streptantibioticus ferralitis]|uniref:Glycoside hydrolase family 76 protein n=1 Tax=Streptantibioticus ferralitis TaxID=236510 RepID=A0ABT5YXX2_9ACTN|nr:glycoside hydrolase family 76 protein [Streptantibioticus ferralitis]MDF2255675.1 glycoside hydrolase family 76 protein [Streptantibioticus ferralitis]
MSAARAIAAYQALQKYLAVNDGSGLYHERYPVVAGDNAYSYEWPFSQAHAATLDLTGLPGEQGDAYLPDLARRSVGQERYWKASGGTTGVPGYASYPEPPYGSGGDFFYDDNEWVGLLDIQQYLMRGDRAVLARAEQIFQLVVSGWDSDPSHADPGGVFWTQATWSQDRNTVSDMPGAELGLRLHQITGQQTYLTWARRMYDWTNRYLLSPDGLYWDHVNLTGTVETTIWSYNQGVPVGVNVLLYEITGDQEYLDRARRIAAAAHAHFVTGGRLLGQPPYFNSIYFKNLLLLEAVTGGRTYREAMAEYADTVWERYRDPGTGLFRFDTGGQTETLQQAAMVQIYAVLGWDPDDHRLLY